MKKIRIGLKGFGEIPRHIYRMCLQDERMEVVAISDFGRPDILNYLVGAEVKGNVKTRIEGNYLVSSAGKARIVKGGEPGQIPWDMFDIDIVIDGTWMYRTRSEMERHLAAGARRVLLTSLPFDTIDRIVIRGVNDHTIKHTDQLISAGSATTNAAALVLKALSENFGVEYSMLTTVHSYTSDQPLRDKAGKDYRKSRSAAENIIPVDTISPFWIQQIMPELNGKVEGIALNVPVPNGSLLDMTTIVSKTGITKDQVNKAMEAAAAQLPGIIQVVEDPIVSSDVIDNSHSLVFDKIATMVTPGRMVKTLTWCHSAYALAARIKEIVLAYHEIDNKGGNV